MGERQCKTDTVRQSAPLLSALKKPNPREHAGYTPVVTQTISLLHFLLSFPFIILRYLLLGGLGHGVEGRTVLEPLNLGLVEGVGQRDLERGAAIGGVDNHGERLANLELGAEKVDLVSS